MIQRWLIGSTYRFLLSTWMIGQPPNRKGAIESLKGDESFRIFNPSNWSSWHLLLTNRDAMPSLLIPPFSVIFTHSYRAVLSLQFFVSCVAWDPSFQEVDAAWQARNMKGICSWLTINWFRPSFLSRKYRSLCFIITFVFRVIMCDDPSFQDQNAVCIKSNMKTCLNVSAMNTYI